MDLRSDIPLPTSDAVGPDGRFREVWWRFFLTLWNRTGQGSGDDSAQLALLIEELQVAVESMSFGAAFAAIQNRLDEGEMPAELAQSAALAVAVAMAAEALMKPEGMVSIPQGSSAHLPSDVGAPQAFEAIPTETAVHGVYEDPDLHALATPSAAGFMSAADKAKLDSL